MSKVTSKLQVTIPKHIAQSYGIVPGTDVAFQSAGEAIRVVVEREPKPRLTLEERIALFRASVARCKRRGTATGKRKDRGWTRDDLYEDRGLPR